MICYKSYGAWMKNRFGCKVQKISIDAGFSCPNRDGKIGRGGCIYCNNATFNPDYCTNTAGRVSQEERILLTTENIKSQLEKGKEFFSRKYPEMKYIAYFQSYTNTYDDIEALKQMYEAALSVPDVVGISIATRPDCVSDELLDYLEELSHRTFLTMEYGVESLNDKTLKIINRGHTSECSINIIRNTHARGIIVCAHLILGLPGESREEILRQEEIINSLPVDFLKLHQLQITKGTILEHRPDLIEQCTLYTPEEYIDLVVEYLSRLRSDIIIERFTSQSPAELLVAPRWGLKNYEFTNLLNKRLAEL
ncbi:MAG: TIGR01212 family radical SAM protein [Prevotellaceae bacterium]|nr:TIGR01212 family radical SAM protein [Prevotellaceae bacterium]